MFLETLRLWNFRRYGSRIENAPGLEIHFHEGVNIIIGENDSGKTAIIDAIRYVLHTRSGEPVYLDEKDFYQDPNGHRTRSLKIECLFGGISSQDAAPFLEWMGLKQGKTGESCFVLRLVLTAKYQDDGRIYSQVKAGMGNDGSLMAAEAKELLRAVYLKPLRDASQDMTHGYKSRIAQILQAHEIFSDNHTDENKKHPIEIQYLYLKNAIDNYFGESGNAGNQIMTALNDTLLKHFLLSNDQRKAHFSLTGNDLTDILRQLDLRLEENKSGLGTLNLLCIAAELLLFLEERKGIKLTLVEEVEAHLHPQYQLRLIDFIQKESSFGQFILTTHSITIGSNIPLQNLIVLSKDGTAYPMDKDHTSCNDEDYSFLHRFLDATKANLFFSKGLIFVEGDAENLLLPTIARIIGRDLHEYGVSIINIGSTAYERYTRIFQRRDKQSMNIPISVVTDLDIRSIEYYNEHSPIKLLHVNSNVKQELLRLCSAVDFDVLPSYMQSWSELDEYITQHKKNKKPISQNTRNAIREYYQTNMSEITSEDIEEMREQRQAVLQGKYSNDDCIKLFAPKEWTLEYEIARSSLFKELAAAIQLAKSKSMNLTINDSMKETYQKYTEATATAQISYDIFKPLNEGTVSKAITAQYLAEILESDKGKYRHLIESDEYLRYLVDAIKHVTKSHDEE